VAAFTGTDSEDVVHQPYLDSRASRIVLCRYFKGGLKTKQTAPGRLSPRDPPC
jgi:hypothetical protein